MKTITTGMLTLIVVLLSPTSSQAHVTSFPHTHPNPAWFQANLNCYVDRGNAVCEIINTGGMSMFCDVHGFFANGQYITSNVAQWVQPGNNLLAYVYTRYPNPPFVNANGNGMCHF
ncbi:hypothetical protein OCF84_20995 (plasmid) [Shewanella xiamenensis]|uniref:Uncharacterized protein n=1 Tax=Shewanella xiamenensis TaxID=332186 RepID=A0ABT6UFX3_9GAMM|nr:hypothetical protein [Shewanella xiamenensis]MDI5832645.1 hypothetical protein [Shewanella xiamenensis]WHF57997.1 hypothetical protein OCF84_20995 [Shewanella xiamenensis]